MFEESCAVRGGRLRYGFEAVLRRHPLVTFVVAADAVLRGVAPRRQPRGDLVDAGSLRQKAEAALEPDSLPDGEEVGRGLAPERAGRGTPGVIRHNARSLSSADWRSAEVIGTIWCVAAGMPIRGR